MNNPVIQARGVRHVYREGKLVTEVLRGIDFDLRPGERVAIVGQSGSGKSTLLHLLGGLETPSEGQIELCGKNLSALSQFERGQLRNQSLGFIYQFHHLLPEFTALENVCMPLLIRGTAIAVARQTATDLLARVGLAHRLDHKPSELSGGERQRAAVARALVNQPRCVLGDEPTGNLDQKTASGVMDLMLELNRTFNTALVLVTHDMKVAERLDRIIHIQDGMLQA